MCVKIPTTGSTGMTSGISKALTATTCLLATALSPIPCRAASESPDAAAIVASLKRAAPARTAFSEVRFSGMLDRPLILHGELEYYGPGKLARTVSAPYAEQMIVADG